MKPYSLQEDSSMKIPMAGEVLRGFCINEWFSGEVMVRLSPAGIQYFLDTKCFSICNRHLGKASLAIVYQDKIDSDDPIAVRCDHDEEIRGNVLIFGFNGSLKPLEDFEMEALRANLILEKKNGKCTVVLNNLNYRKNEAVEELIKVVEQESNEKQQTLR